MNDKKEVVDALQKKLNIKNPMALPKILKIVVNMGVKNALEDKKNLQNAADMLGKITGQKARVAKAKKSISTFKLREGDPIGLVVTLRGKRMYDFLNKIINIVLPRLRDFHGVKKTSFDGYGNYTLGFAESAVFPEIDAGRIDLALLRQGMEVTIVTTAKNNEEGVALLEVLGMPFEK
jgi:large subunit ribosomal protein L5